MPQPAADKIIVTNLAVLTQKYGAAGAKKVSGAVKKLITADAARGIVARLVDLSHPATMAGYGASPIAAASAADAKLNKDAIDKVFSYGAVRPAYLMLLGSTDVIPHVALDNPMDGDGDADLPSDLPYACDQPYSVEVQDFIAPTRVVGRLPNVTGDSNPAYLVKLLGTAANYTARPAANYNAFLGISAHVWKKSTQLSLDTVFGTFVDMQVSPANGPKWTATQAKRLAHFVNCHGAPADPTFYGQKGAAYPVAHSAAWMTGKLAEGTVMAAECCYGAELYDPALAGGQMGICNAYLAGKAYACLGSTNIAYGPAAANDLADLICQDFLLQILFGASTGRACLQSRLDYVLGKGGVLTPTDLKTLGQFNLIGDPSLTPIAATPHAAAIPAAKGSKAPKIVADTVERHARLSRRAGLVAQAAGATAYRLLSPAAPPGGGKSGMFGKLRKMAADLGIKTPDVVLSYTVGSAPELAGAKGISLSRAVAGSAPKAVHAVLERLPPPPASSSSFGTRSARRRI